MSIIVPFTSPTVLITTLSTEYFGATLAVLVLLLCCCGFLIWKNSKHDGGGRGIFLYVAMLFLMSLLFTVVSIKEEHIEYDAVPADATTSSVEYDFVINGNRIDIYERTVNHINKNNGDFDYED